MELYHYFFEIILISVLDTIKQEAMVRTSCYNVLEQKWQSAHFIILGPKYFNKFPTSIRNSKSYVTFKTLSMEYLMN